MKGRRDRWLSASLAGAGLLVALGVLEGGLRLIGLGTPVLYENRLAYGYRPAPGQSLRRLWGSRVRINRLGLRGPEVAERPAAGTLRLLFLGDSVTYGGSYIDDANLFSTLAAESLEARLRRPDVTAVEALNAGVNGWGPQNMRGFLEVEGAFGSHIIVVTLIEGDFRREKTHLGEVPYFSVPPATAMEEVLVLAAYRIFTAYKRPKPAADLVSLARANLEAFRAIAEQGRSMGTRVLFVWHPLERVLADVRPPTGDTTPPTQREPNKAALWAMASETDAATLDLTPVHLEWMARGGESTYEDGLHLSATGHAVVGRAIGERLATLLSSIASE